jgi:hypothetical protein
MLPEIGDIVKIVNYPQNRLLENSTGIIEYIKEPTYVSDDFTHYIIKINNSTTRVELFSSEFKILMKRPKLTRYRFINKA